MSHFMQAWRGINSKLVATPPKNANEVLNCSLWWTTHYLGDHFGFSIQRARTLSQRGLLSLRDLLDPSGRIPHQWPTVKASFPLLATEQPLIAMYVASIPPAWNSLLLQTADQACIDDRIGVFPEVAAEVPTLLFQATEAFRPPLSQIVVSVSIPTDLPRFSVGSHSRCLIRLPEQVITTHGCVLRSRVLAQLKPSKKTAARGSYYLAPVVRLTLDSRRWAWDTGDSLFDYTAKTGRKLLQDQQSLSLPILLKWQDSVPQTFVPDSKQVWAHPRPRNEAAFLWSTYNSAMAVNQWRH